MSQTDGARRTPSVASRPSVPDDPKMFLVPRWMFGLAVTLVSAAVVATLAFVDLATKSDLEPLAKQTDMAALQHKVQVAEQDLRALENTHVSQGEADAYVECVSTHLFHIHEFLKGLASWSEKQSIVEVRMLAVLIFSPETFTNYMKMAVPGDIETFNQRKQFLGNQALARFSIVDHHEGLETIKRLNSAFKIDVRECARTFMTGQPNEI